MIYGGLYMIQALLLRCEVLEKKSSPLLFSAFAWFTLWCQRRFKLAVLDSSIWNFFSQTTKLVSWTTTFVGISRYLNQRHKSYLDIRILRFLALSSFCTEQKNTKRRCFVLLEVNKVLTCLIGEKQRFTKRIKRIRRTEDRNCACVKFCLVCT